MTASEEAQKSAMERYTTIAVAVGCVALWITLSSSVILYNKWVLAYFGFPYPLFLTMFHMGFGSTLAFLCVRVFKVVEPINMPAHTYMTSVVPIGVLFSATLCMSNAAYLYLSVSFIQMLKATIPVATFLIGCIARLETFRWLSLGNVVVISVGVMIASYGELNFDGVGVTLQMTSVLIEAVRLIMVQILLQSKGLKMNPITSLYYISPVCFVCILLPFFMLEMPKMYNDPTWNWSTFIFVSNAATAFALNLSVFLLIGKTSALTMNVAGVVKDWILIGLSVVMYGSPVTSTNLGGFTIAFLGVAYFNYCKMKRNAAPKSPGAGEAAAGEARKA